MLLLTNNCNLKPKQQCSLELGDMLETDSRFRALANDHEKGSFLFTRLRYPFIEILDFDKAYRVSIANPLASIAGCFKPPAKQLLSLLLSIPNTTARIAADELQLRCTDKSSVQLLVRLPVTSIPAKPVLQALHLGLMLAAATLEGALLETVGADVLTEIGEVSPESLDVLHAPLITGGQPVELRSAFRRVAAADTRVHAARAFAVAQTAEKVRGEILGKRKERQDQERRKRQRERERVREAKKLILAGRGVKRPRRSLFDIENDSPNGNETPRADIEDKTNNTDTNRVTESAVASIGAASREDSHLNNNTETTIRAGNPSASNRVAQSRDGQQSGTVQREADEPSQRKKKRKVRKLV